MKRFTLIIVAIALILMAIPASGDVLRRLDEAVQEFEEHRSWGKLEAHAREWWYDDTGHRHYRRRWHRRNS